MRNSSHRSLVLAGFSLFALAATAWAQGPTDLFLGTNAGNPGVSTGARDTAVGVNSMAALTSGNSNTGLGYNSLLSCTSGGSNTALGTFSQNATTTGSVNTSVGSGSLSANTTGSGNVAVGNSAMSRNTTSGDNVAVGLNALFFTTAGSNTAVGSNALATDTTGTGNIGLGYFAGSNISSGSNNIDIGNSAPGNESDTIRIGNTQTAAFLAGVSGVTVASGVQVYIDSNGQLGTLTSSVRYKEDVADMAGASRLLMQLRPVTFRYKAPYDDGSHRLQYGLIAEEVAKVDPELVQFDGKGQAQTVRYHVVNMMLLNEVQRQEGKLADQTAEIGTLRALTDRQRAELDQQKQLLAEQNARLQKLEALLANQTEAPKAP
ncbi:MAG TPA: tail fiber domain-containing protein [Thermoanaerobaculia bacterium]|nr:tail fiber domain-containing protein [Thermoanaerobaculia bacterium]